MHKHAGEAAPPIFDDSGGGVEMSHSGEFKIVGSMESLVEMVQIIFTKLYEFYLLKRVFMAFKTLKPMSFRGSAPGPWCQDGISNENSTN